jgi:hypothetical protein
LAVNSTKAHIAALSLLDRAFLALTDAELAGLLTTLPEDHVSAIKKISSFREDDASAATAAEDDDAAADASPELVESVRAAAHKGRLNGDLQRLGVVLSDACLAQCIEALGDKSEMPSEDDLQGVIPKLIEDHGLGVVRLMLASTVVGEAPASATIVSMLKTDETIKLPPADPKPVAPLLPRKQDDAERLALKAQRKERKAQEQAEARLRREQVARARNRV